MLVVATSRVFACPFPSVRRFQVEVFIFVCQIFALIDGTRSRASKLRLPFKSKGKSSFHLSSTSEWTFLTL